ncbi:hypothetical protein ASC68_25410 [Devosia sp. Root105]|nr:hypothetical protein ASC68_25410 [Devosia sp. Root105]
MTKPPLYKPGQQAPRSGQYEMTGPRGGPTGIERTVVKNEPMPPTKAPGQRYKMVDPTKHGK